MDMQFQLQRLFFTVIRVGTDEVEFLNLTTRKKGKLAMIVEVVRRAGPRVLGASALSGLPSPQSFGDDASTTARSHASSQPHTSY
jgi:hypothetical protein